MKLETIKNKCIIPEKILLTSSSSAWMLFTNWKLSDYNDDTQPYIENIPYSLFELNCRTCNIIDGRGFNIKLNYQNMSMLITNAKIKNGRILEPCQYLKINNSFWILPTRIIAQ